MEKIINRIDDKKGLITLIIALLTIFYYTTVMQTQFEAKIEYNTSEIHKIENRITSNNLYLDKRFEAVNTNKVDMIVFDMLMKSLEDIKADLKYLRDGKK